MDKNLEFRNRDDYIHALQIAIVGVCKPLSEVKRFMRSLVSVHQCLGGTLLLTGVTRSYPIYANDCVLLHGN